MAEKKTDEERQFDKAGNPVLTDEERAARWAKRERADAAAAKIENARSVELVTLDDYVVGLPGDVQVVIPCGTLIAEIPGGREWPAVLRGPDGRELPEKTAVLTRKQLRKLLANVVTREVFDDARRLAERTR